MHPLVRAFEDKEDASLLKQMRFHSAWDQCEDVKIARLLRRAANRIEELKNRET